MSWEAMVTLFDEDSVRGQFLFLASALLQDGEGQPIDIQMKSRMDGTYACSYTPVKAIKHTIAVVWGGVNIPHSPYRVGCETESCHCMKKPSPVAGLGCMLDGQGDTSLVDLDR